MKIVHIKDKLSSIDVPVESLCLGDFDQIGEHCAKKMRDAKSPLYASVGAYFRPNYERGILIYSLIRRFGITSMLEIGFGRGYACLCAAKAFYDCGIDGKIVTIDPNLPGALDNLRNVMPPQLLRYIQPVQGTSQAHLPNINEKYELVYIDGDHSYEGTKHDWLGVKDKFSKFVLFDDYHLPTKDDPGIKCNKAIDEIDWKSEGCREPELIRMDRRIFFDDRRMTDEQVDYGQVLLAKENFAGDEW